MSPLTRLTAKYGMPLDERVSGGKIKKKEMSTRETGKGEGDNSPTLSNRNSSANVANLLCLATVYI